MDEIIESSGSLADKHGAINKSLRTTLTNIHQPWELFPLKHKPTEVELEEAALEKMIAERDAAIIEKEIAAREAAILGTERGARSDPPRSSSAIEKDVADAASAGELTCVEKALVKSGFDKLPMTDRAKEVLDTVLSNGGEPVTQFTGRMSIERGIASAAPAMLTGAKVEKAGVLDRPTEGDNRAAGPAQLKVGDRVIPLQWTDVGPFGAKFDLLHVPQPSKVKKLHIGPAVVTKDSFPPGNGPADATSAETVEEERLYAIELEPEGVEKDADCVRCAILTKDTTMVLRLEPLMEPSGYVPPGRGS